MPTQKIPDLDAQYLLINFDDQGKEHTDDAEGGTFSRKILASVQQDKPTDIFLFSHGWQGDIPAAIDQYDRWIGAMWKQDADRQAMGEGFRPMFIGLHWPSLPWGEETVPAAGAPVSFGTSDAPDISSLIDSAVDHFGGGDAVRQPLEAIFAAFAQDPAAQQLPHEVVAAYGELGKAIGFSANGSVGSAPDEEGAGLDPQGSVQAQRDAGVAASFGIFDTIKSGILSGLRQASFWLMKHRARTIGEQGMHQFVAQLQQTSEARIHLMGHSFGCIVVSSILGGPNGNSPLPRPVNSVALVQGALSLWSFADQVKDGTTPGYFKPVLTSGAVSGPIVTTQSGNDYAVGIAYPAAVAVVNEVVFGVGELPKFGGVGAFGVQGTQMADQKTMSDGNPDYGFRPGRIYNMDGTAFIPGHSHIDGPQVAHLLWQAAQQAKAGHGA